MSRLNLKLLTILSFLAAAPFPVSAQMDLKMKYANSQLYCGIEVGSKGVKLSVLEVGKNAQSNGAFQILKDTAVNTDFISFSQPTFQATLDGLYNLYQYAMTHFQVPSERVFTVISSGVKMQAEKDNKTEWVNTFIDSFKVRTGEPGRRVEVVDVLQEGRLSHLGIVPNSKRYTTFLIDIGSGNTKGGYFPYGNTRDFRLFQLNWGTKSTANETEKRCDELDKTLANYQRQLERVLAAAEDRDIVYAINVSGAYKMNDYIAFSGGIAWAVATLTHPEAISNTVVTVTYEDVVKLFETLYSNYQSLQPANLAKSVKEAGVNKEEITREAKRVHQVFDQRALMAGSGLLLRIMRQFKSVFETKQFYLVKNGQVGWVSAYVDNATQK